MKDIHYIIQSQRCSYKKIAANASTSSPMNTKKIAFSVYAPVCIMPLTLLDHGQNGCMPSIVKLSASKCNEYPKKKGNASIGMKKANKTEIKMHKVKL